MLRPVRRCGGDAAGGGLHLRRCYAVGPRRSGSPRPPPDGPWDTARHDDRPAALAPARPARRPRRQARRLRRLGDADRVRRLRRRRARASTPRSARRWACSTSPTSARHGVRGPGRGRRSSNACADQRPRPDRARAGAVHAVLRRRRRRRGRRPHRVPVRATTTCSWCRTRPTRPRWCAGSPPRRPAGVDGHRRAPRLRRAGRAGPALGRAAGPARAAVRARLHELHRLRAGTAPSWWSAAPATPASTGTSCCRRPGGPPRSGTRCWRPGADARRASRAAWAPGTRCGPRWATRCTGRTCPWRSPRCRRARAGRSAGRSRRSGAGTALLAEKERGPARLLWGIEALERGIPRPHMPVLRRRRPGRRGHQRHVLADPEEGHRPGAARHRGRGRRGRRGRRRRARAARAGPGGQAALRAAARPLTRVTARRATTIVPPPARSLLRVTVQGRSRAG